jgi:hypothetical protein
MKTIGLYMDGTPPIAKVTRDLISLHYARKPAKLARKVTIQLVRTGTLSEAAPGEERIETRHLIERCAGVRALPAA